MKRLLRSISFIICILGMAWQAEAQGITSAAIRGTVTDASGAGLPGATVIAVHEPTGTKYGTVTNVEGKYNFSNLKVGGPYVLTVSFVGYQTAKITGIQLSLGEKASYNVKMQESTQQLEEVKVVAKSDNVIDITRTGASTNIGEQQIATLPTLSRSIGDFARLTPQFNSTPDGGLSFGGTNNRYNNVMIDGAVNNDVFGLNANGSPGGRTGSEPISLDAIKQIQVVLAPYDVRQSGFTGAGINAVTRSGSNKLEGSAYYFVQDEALQGKSIPTETNPNREKSSTFSKNQFGFRIGGPIIKDKLFFFANAEIDLQSRPYNTELVYPSDSLSQALNILRNTYNYDPGDPYKEISNDQNAGKGFVRFDYNISDKHKLVVRDNFNRSYTSDLFRGSSNYSLNNSQYRIQNTTNSFVTELNSNFNSNLSNEFRFGYTMIRDERVPVKGKDFPQFIINDNSSTGQDIYVGAGRYDALNSLDQDQFELTDNFTWFKGNHTFTFGTRNEFYHFNNLFIESGFGEWEFPNLTALQEGKPTSLRKDYSLTDNFRQGAKWGALQLGLYAQDEWDVLSNLRLTLGIRADMPIILDDVPRNTTFGQSFGLRNDVTPRANVLWSPRLGFNWDVFDNKKTQLRGGVGVFSGRAPFVWLSNQYSKNGVEFASARFGLSEINTIMAGKTQAERIALLQNVTYRPDPNLIDQTVEIDVSDPNLKLPQVLRFNAGWDQELPYGLTSTLEGIFSKTLNDIYVRDINLRGPIGVNARGRNLWGYAPNDPAFVDSKNFTNVYVLENTSAGYTMNLTAKLQKRSKNWYAMAAYTYTIAKDLKSGTQSIAGGNWAGTPIVQSANDPQLAYSDFSTPHRVVASVSYNFNYSKLAGTSVSLYYNGQSGRRYSYVYNGDVNFDALDTRTNNDLIYIPKDRTEITFAGSPSEQMDQWNAFDQFIESDPYLSQHRGEFAERNGAVGPWTNTLDLKVLQNFYVNVAGRKNTIQLSADVFNFSNMMNYHWGNNYYTNERVLQVKGIDPNTKLPIVSFNPNFQSSNVNRFGSTWRMQLGLRYIF